MIEPRREASLLAPLLTWLAVHKRLGASCRLAVEFPWLGRRVDAAALTSTGRLLAFELKIDNHSRAMEQASCNKLVFDRSYIVTSKMPTTRILKAAQRASVGIILIDRVHPTLVCESAISRGNAAARERLVRSLRAKGGPFPDVRQRLLPLSELRCD